MPQASLDWSDSGERRNDAALIAPSAPRRSVGKRAATLKASIVSPRRNIRRGTQLWTTEDAAAQAPRPPRRTGKSLSHYL
jgi:hypothetical protein